MTALFLSFLQKGIMFEIQLDEKGIKEDAEKEKEKRREEEEEKVSNCNFFFYSSSSSLSLSHCVPDSLNRTWTL